MVHNGMDNDELSNEVFYEESANARLKTVQGEQEDVSDEGNDSIEEVDSLSSSGEKENEKETAEMVRPFLQSSYLVLNLVSHSHVQVKAIQNNNIQESESSTVGSKNLDAIGSDTIQAVFKNMQKMAKANKSLSSVTPPSFTRKSFRARKPKNQGSSCNISHVLLKKK